MDDIQRKLAIIDEQLGQGKGLHQRIISQAPLFFAACGLIAGILMQETVSFSLSLWIVILSVITAAAIAIYTMWNKRSVVVFAYLAFTCFVCVGGARFLSFYRPTTNNVQNFVGDEKKLATIRGTIVTMPFINRHNRWAMSRFKFTDPGTSFYLKLSEVKTPDGWVKVGGTVRVQVAEPMLDLQAGDAIQAYCWLDRFSPATNPGEFDVAKYLARKNVFVGAYIKSRESIKIRKDKPSGLFAKLKTALRETASEGLLSNVEREGQTRGLLQALLLGYRSEIDSNAYIAFEKTGLLHFISLSGLHVGILIGIIWWILARLGIYKSLRALFCIFAVGVFLLIVPSRAPTLRAGIICWVFFLSLLFRRRFNSLNALSLAAIILLLIRPTQIFEAGWQLSFATVLGLVIFCERIHLFLYEKITGIGWHKVLSKTKPFYRITARAGPYFLELFSTGLTAWLSGAGIILYHFHTISPLTFIWTIIVFPLVAGVLTIGFIKIILSLFLPSIAFVLGYVVTCLSEILIRLVKFFADFDFSEIVIGEVSVLLILFYYGILLFTRFGRFTNPAIKKVPVTAAIITVITILGVTKWNRTHNDSLILSTLDVGHGQAILAQIPDAGNLLFDAGSFNKKDVGNRIIIPFLKKKGISRLDAIIISHSDIDHINGVIEIAKRLKVDKVRANENFFEHLKKSSSGPAGMLYESLSDSGLTIKEFNDNNDVKLRIKKLWPDESAANNPELEDNDKSLVILIEFAGKKVLLCSDIEKFAQKKLLQLYPELTAEIIFVPHHGSANTLEENFLLQTKEEIFICNCSGWDFEQDRVIKPGKEGHFYYTAKDGAIFVRIDKDGTIKTSTFISQQ